MEKRQNLSWLCFTFSVFVLGMLNLSKLTLENKQNHIIATSGFVIYRLWLVVKYQNVISGERFE